MKTIPCDKTFRGGWEVTFSDTLLNKACMSRVRRETVTVADEESALYPRLELFLAMLETYATYGIKSPCEISLEFVKA